MVKLYLFIVAMLSLILINACDSQYRHQPVDDRSEQKIVKICESDLTAISNKTIFFGHQSVGANIIDGLLALAGNESVIEVKKYSSVTGLERGRLNHMYLGQNYDPFGKIRSFVQVLSNFDDNQPDIAFFKFCYLDVDTSTDVFRLFNFYKQAMAEIKKQHPETEIMHATIPLLQIQTGPKAWIKRALGKPITGLADNVARGRFNELLLAEYGARAVIFDIAQFESTYPDGGRESFVWEGKIYYALVHRYSDDGAHLNELGREILAVRLVQALSDAAQRHASKATR